MNLLYYCNYIIPFGKMFIMLTSEWLHLVLYFSTEYHISRQNIIILFWKYLVDIRREAWQKKFWEYIHGKFVFKTQTVFYLYNQNHQTRKCDAVQTSWHTVADEKVWNILIPNLSNSIKLKSMLVFITCLFLSPTLTLCSNAMWFHKKYYPKLCVLCLCILYFTSLPKIYLKINVSNYLLLTIISHFLKIEINHSIFVISLFYIQR
jgi:hypothetical protein